MKDYLKELLGVPSIVVFFGFVGGVLSLSVGGARRPWIAVASVVSGIICSTVFTPVVRELWHYPEAFQSAIAFVLGLGGYNIVKFFCEKINGRTLSAILTRWTGKDSSRGAVDDKDA